MERPSLGSRNSKGAMYEAEGGFESGVGRKPPSQQKFQKQRIVQSEIPTRQLEKVETFGFEKNFLEVADQVSEDEQKEEEVVTPEQRLLRQYEKVDWRRLGDIDFGVASPTASQKPTQKHTQKSIDLLFDDISVISPVGQESQLNFDANKQFAQPVLTQPANTAISPQPQLISQNFWAMQDPDPKPQQQPTPPADQTATGQASKKVLNQEIVESEGFLEF